MLLLAQIIRSNKNSYHNYADDTQLYIRMSPNDFELIQALNKLEQINAWRCHSAEQEQN